MDKKPNIILIITDQQRFDTIHALGAPWMRTPNLDRLAARGAAFTHCFTTSPVCVGARASLFSGVYPHAHNVYTNFDLWAPTWVDSLASAGYHCVNIGKMHTNPYDTPGGFHQRFVVENKDRPLFLEECDRAYYDEWDKALHAHKLAKPSRYSRFQRDPEGYRKSLGAFTWELPEALHPDVFVGDFASWWLQERKADNPLFLQIGFPGPHPPYDPPEDWLKEYDDVAIPVPDVTAAELAAQPHAQAVLRDNMIRSNYDSVAWKMNPSSEELLRLRCHYAANVTLIDAQVGKILDVVRQRGEIDNTIVIFTSDHGDNLGDHGHIQKWNMYEGAVRVPLIVAGSARAVSGQVSEELVQLFDIAPTILEAAGIPAPANWEARSLWPLIDGARREPGRDAVYAELARDHIQSGAEYMIMRRTRKWKFVFYLGTSEGELYDLEEDPAERKNLWTDPLYGPVREDMTRETLLWSLEGSFRSRRKPTRRPQQPMLIG